MTLTWHGSYKWQIIFGNDHKMPKTKFIQLGKIYSIKYKSRIKT